MTDMRLKWHEIKNIVKAANTITDEFRLERHIKVIDGAHVVLLEIDAPCIPEDESAVICIDDLNKLRIGKEDPDIVLDMKGLHVVFNNCIYHGHNMDDSLEYRPPNIRWDKPVTFNKINVDDMKRYIKICKAMKKDFVRFELSQFVFKDNMSLSLLMKCKADADEFIAKLTDDVSGNINPDIHSLIGIKYLIDVFNMIPASVKECEIIIDTDNPMSVLWEDGNVKYKVSIAPRIEND